MKNKSQEAPVSADQWAKELQVRSIIGAIVEGTKHPHVAITELLELIKRPVSVQVEGLRLDLKLFRKLNTERAVEGFKTYENVPLSFWGLALAGELGELCNMIKKIERVKMGGIDAGSSYTAADITTEMMEEEIGGIAIYLDLLASLLKIDLEEAIIKTFNSKSEKYKFKQYLSSASGQEKDAVDYKAKYEKCINVIKRFDAGIIGLYDL